MKTVSGKPSASRGVGQRAAVVAGGRGNEPRLSAAPVSRERSAALNAPRILYEQVGWTTSSFRKTFAVAGRQPFRSAQRRLRRTRPWIRSAAARDVVDVDSA